MIELGQQILEIGWLITKIVFTFTALIFGVMMLLVLAGVARK